MGQAENKQQYHKLKHNQKLNSVTLKANLSIGSKQRHKTTWLSTRNVHKILRDRLKVNGWKKIYHENTNLEKVRLGILTSDKVDFTEGILPRIRKNIS